MPRLGSSVQLLCVVCFAGVSPRFAGVRVGGSAKPLRLAVRRYTLAFVPEPNIIQVNVRATLLGQQVENVFNVDNLAAPDEAALELVASTFSSWVSAEYKNFCSASTTFTEVVTRDKSSADGGQFVLPLGSGVAGTFGGTPLPNNCTIACSLRTSSGGRSGHGRFYWIGLTRNHQADPNTLDSSVAAGMLTAAANLIASVNDISKKLVVVSRQSLGVPRPGGPVYFPITSAVFTDLTFDSARRRLPGRGT